MSYLAATWRSRLGLYPALLPSSSDPADSLTIRNAAAAASSLSIGLVWWGIGMLIAIGYFVIVYTMFRGKVRTSGSLTPDDKIGDNAHRAVRQPADHLRRTARSLREYQPAAVPACVSAAPRRCSPAARAAGVHTVAGIHGAPGPHKPSAVDPPSAPCPAGGVLFSAADNHTVQWRRDPACSVDVHEFDAAIARARAPEEIAALEEAVRLYQDDLLRGSYDEWLQPRREHYRQQFASVLNRLALLLEDAAIIAAAIRHAERLVALDPLREAHHQVLIRLHTANRDRASALARLSPVHTRSAPRTGVDPAPATRELYRPCAARPSCPPAATPNCLRCASAPLVGRKREWERLQECWKRWYAARHAWR